MIRFRLPTLHALWLILAMAQGCSSMSPGGTEAGNPGVFTLKLVEPEKLVASRWLQLDIIVEPSFLSSPLTIQTAIFHAERVLLILPQGKSCNDVEITSPAHLCLFNGALQRFEVTVGGPFYFDLLVGTADPPIFGILLPAGNYQGLIVHLSNGVNLPPDTPVIPAEHMPCGDDVAFCVLGETEDGEIGYGFGSDNIIVYSLLADGFEVESLSDEAVVVELDAERFIEEINALSGF